MVFLGDVSAASTNGWLTYCFYIPQATLEAVSLSNDCRVNVLLCGASLAFSLVAGRVLQSCSVWRLKINGNNECWVLLVRAEGGGPEQPKRGTGKAAEMPHWWMMSRGVFWSQETGVKYTGEHVVWTEVGDWAAGGVRKARTGGSNPRGSDVARDWREHLR